MILASTSNRCVNIFSNSLLYYLNCFRTLLISNLLQHIKNIRMRESIIVPLYSAAISVAAYKFTKPRYTAITYQPSLPYLLQKHLCLTVFSLS